MKALFLALLFYVFFILNTSAQGRDSILSSSGWVDSVYKTLSLTEQIEQLFMVSVYSNGDDKYCEEKSEEICKYKPGGVAFFKGGPLRQAYLTNRFQQEANIPLLIGIQKNLPTLLINSVLILLFLS